MIRSFSTILFNLLSLSSNASEFPVDKISDPKFLNFFERKKLGGKFDLPGEKKEDLS